MQLRGLGALVFIIQVAVAVAIAGAWALLSTLAAAIGPGLAQYHGPVSLTSPAAQNGIETAGEVSFFVTFDLVLATQVVVTALLVWALRKARRDSRDGRARDLSLVVEYAFGMAIAQAGALGVALALIRRVPAGFFGWELLLMVTAGVVGLAACSFPSRHARAIALGCCLLLLVAGAVSGLMQPALFLRPSILALASAFTLVVRRPDLGLRAWQAAPWQVK